MDELQFTRPPIDLGPQCAVSPAVAFYSGNNDYRSSQPSAAERIIKAAQRIKLSDHNTEKDKDKDKDSNKQQQQQQQHKNANSTSTSSISRQKSRLRHQRFDGTLMGEASSQSELTQPLYSLIEEIFDLQSKGWLGRKAVIVARTILKLTANTFIHTWLQDSVVNALSEQQIVKVIDMLNHLTFPHGKLFTPARKQSEEEKEIMRNQAKELLTHSVNKAVSTILGTYHCNQALTRIWSCMQCDIIAQHFVYSCIDALVQELCPELANVLSAD
jgi:hypothetical protein